MEQTKRDQFIRNVLYAACIAAIVFLVFRYCIPLLAPFLVAFLVTALIAPLVNLLHKKLRIAKKISSVVLVTVTYLILAGLLVLGGNGVYQWIVNADGWFQTTFVPTAFRVFSQLAEWLTEIDADLVPFLATLRDSLISTIGSKVSSISADVLSKTATGLPGFLIRVIFAIVASYFMAVDADRIKNFISVRMTDEQYATVSAAYAGLKATIGRYLRAYSLIFLITFAELTVGFLCAGIDKFVLIALLVAIFDILPVFGSSMVLLPWSIILFIMGDYRRGAVMFAVYAVVVVVRQFIEPKIVGENVGLHPLITLTAMYVGGKLFGGIGLIGLPVTCAVLVQLQSAGVVNLFPQRRTPEVVPTEPRRRFFKKKEKKTNLSKK